MKGYFIGVVVGAACMGGGMLMARAVQNAGPCLDMVVVSELVDGCMDGSVEVCVLLDETVPASCLIERAVEATEVKRMRFDAQAEGITL